MKYFLYLLLTLYGFLACSQQGGTANSTSSSADYGTFEGYAFVLDGTTISHKDSPEYPDAILYKIFPEGVKLDGHAYAGAIDFSRSKHSLLPDPYANDPAWFINGSQVSSFDIRSSRPELY